MKTLDTALPPENTLQALYDALKAGVPLWFSYVYTLKKGEYRGTPLDLAGAWNYR